jgi:hypothetical protein
VDSDVLGGARRTNVANSPPRAITMAEQNGPHKSITEKGTPSNGEQARLTSQKTKATSQRCFHRYVTVKQPEIKKPRVSSVTPIMAGKFSSAYTEGAYLMTRNFPRAKIPTIISTSLSTRSSFISGGRGY